MSKPYTPQGTKSRFYIPPTLASDFTEFLDNDVPNAVMDFELLQDWYTQFEDGYEPVVIRGELYPDSTKSRYTNTDNNLNIRCDVASGIKKGDYVIASNDKTIYLLDWSIALESNNTPSRALRCNAKLTFEKYHNEIVDELGYLVMEEGWQTVAKDLPCNVYRYDGRPEYSAVSGTPGMTPNALTIITMQFNSHTEQIRVDDRFVFGPDRYIVIDVNYSGLNVNGEYGTITVQARKEAGGAVTGGD